MLQPKLKPRDCPECDVEFIPRNGFQKTCPSPVCALRYHKRQETEKRERSQRRRDRDWKRANKPVRDLLKDAQGAVNAFVRFRDEGQPCISCNATQAEVERDQHWKVGGAWDAGHYRTRAAASHLRFNLFNLHRQCKHCNGGNGKYQNFGGREETVRSAYRANLAEKIGENLVERLECDNEPRTFDRDYLERITVIFRKRLRLYKRIRGAQ